VRDCKNPISGAPYKLARETKRGMKEASEQDYRAGGRAPYGYRRVEHAMPEGHRGDRDSRA
jgi:hypothetical protein